MKKSLLTSTNSAQIFKKIEELNSSYKKKFNKNSKVELFYSSMGSERAQYSVVAYYGPEDEKELEYFESLLKE